MWYPITKDYETNLAISFQKETLKLINYKYKFIKELNIAIFYPEFVKFENSKRHLFLFIHE